MPFSSASLAALVQGNGFTLWHYRTADARAVVSAAGYFTPASTVLRTGDIIILQAADALALVPVRTGTAIGTGLTVDGTAGPLALVRVISQAFGMTQTASAVVRSLILAPLAAGIVVGGSIPVSAQITGPIAQVVFTLRDAADTVVPPTRVVTVSNGQASATFPVPAPGNGYSVQVEDASDPALSDRSPTFTIGGFTASLLLQESGFRLLLQDGSALLT